MLYGVALKHQSIPESEGGASREEDRLGLRLGLLEETEEGMVFHTDLPEDFTAVPTAHQELQRVLVRALVQGEGGTHIDVTHISNTKHQPTQFKNSHTVFYLYSLGQSH